MAPSAHLPLLRNAAPAAATAAPPQSKGTARALVVPCCIAAVTLALCADVTRAAAATPRALWSSPQTATAVHSVPTVLQTPGHLQSFANGPSHLRASEDYAQGASLGPSGAISGVEYLPSHEAAQPVSEPYGASLGTLYAAGAATVAALGLIVSKFWRQAPAAEDQWAMATFLGFPAPAASKPTAEQVIRAMYDNINNRDVQGALQYVDDNCVYQDLNFPEPFEGIDAVEKLFTDSCNSIPADLLFCIDEITTKDPLACGVTWHVELDGIPFPNGRGCSYYRICPKSNKLLYARDCVESPLKPGEASFFLLRFLSPVVRTVLAGQRNPESQRSATEATEIKVEVAEEPSKAMPLQGGTAVSALLWVLAVAYTYFLFVSPPGGVVPGEPAWAIKPEDLKEVIDESTNFFYILPTLNALGIRVLEAPVVNPTSEALFNITEAFIFMMLPLLLVDLRKRKLPTVPIWSGAMFLTNAMLMPYMALRASTPVTEPVGDKGPLARPFGIVGGLVGLVSVFWFFLGRPETGGDLPERIEFFSNIIVTQRASFAFCLDVTIFSIFQTVLIGAVEPPESNKRWLRWVPFWGLAGWLVL